MYLFISNAVQTIYLLAISASAPVTGLVAADFTCYLSKAGSAPAAVVLTGLVLELDAVNTPGLYAVSMPSASFDTAGFLAIEFSSVSCDTYRILGQVGLQTMVADTNSLADDAVTLIGGLTTDVATVNARVAVVDTVVDGIATDVGALDLGPISASLAELRALAAQVNFSVTGTTYDTNGNLTASTISGWAAGADIDVDPALITLTMTAVYNTNGTLDSMRIEE